MTNAFSEGDIIEYPYRWVRERDAHRSPDGEKDRPCCLVLMVQDAAGRPMIFLAPISSKPPREDQIALEIPEMERRRAGLERYPQAWIYVDEVNADLLNASWHLRPQTPIGAFGRSFFVKVATEIRTRAGRGRIVRRR